MNGLSILIYKKMYIEDLGCSAYGWHILYFVFNKLVHRIENTDRIINIVLQLTEMIKHHIILNKGKGKILGPLHD